VNGDKLKNHSTKFILDSLEKTELNYSWIRAKANATVTFQNESNSVKVNYRVRKDSAIWVNLSKSAVPILTSLLSQDSVKFLKKINGKEYFLGDYSEINKLLNIDLDFMLLQDFIIGNPIMFDYDGKFKSKIDGDKYLLSSDKSKKIDKLLKKGKDLKKYDLLYRCWIEPSNFKCSKVEINFLSDSTTLIVNYSNWFEADGKAFPEISSINFSSPSDTISLEMEFSSKIKLDEVQKFPFNITESYEQFKLNE